MHAGGLEIGWSWLLVIMALVAINTVVVYAVRTHEVYRAAFAGLWVLGIRPQRDSNPCFGLERATS